MSNERFRDLKIGDKIFAYCHNEYTKIVEGIVTSIEGRLEYPNLTNREISIEGISVEFILPNYKTQSDEKKSFYIRFSEEKSRLGVKYTGFLTIEGALEFSNELKVDKIKELEEKIKKEEKRHNELLTKYDIKN